MSQKKHQKIIKSLIKYRINGPSIPPKFEKLPDVTYNCLATLEHLPLAGKLENDAKVCQIQNSPFASFTELMDPQNPILKHLF